MAGFWKSSTLHALKRSADMLLPQTNVHPFCISRMPSAKVLNALVDYGYNLERFL